MQLLSSSLLCLSLLFTPIASPLEDLDALRAEIAQDFVEILPIMCASILDAETRAANEELESRLEMEIEAKLLQLPESELELLGEDDAAFIEDLVRRYEPDSLHVVAEFREACKFRDTEGKLLTIQVVLEMMAAEEAQYPTPERWQERLNEDDLRYQQLSVDGWGNELRYQRSEPYEYLVSSDGPDLEGGTEDDWHLDRERGIFQGHHFGAQESPRTPQTPKRNTGVDLTAPRPAKGLFAETVLGRIAADEKLENTIPGGPDGMDLLFIEGPQGMRVLRDSQEVARLPLETEILRSSDVGTLAYLEEAGEETYLVYGEERVELEYGSAEVQYLSGSGKLIYRDGFRSHLLETGGEVSEPFVWDLRHELVGFREIRDGAYYVHTTDGVFGPAEWASIPVVLYTGEDEYTIAFRMWDGEGTKVYFGTDAWECTWAGVPFVSPEGGHFGVVANFGGRPGRDFEDERDQREDPWARRETRKPDPAHELFEGGTFSVLIDGKAGPAYEVVRDPLFNADGTIAFYRAKDSSGRWRGIMQSEDGTGGTDLCDELPGLLIDESHERIAFDYVNDGTSWIAAAGLERVSQGPVLDRIAGPKGNLAFVVGDDSIDSGRKLFWVQSNPGETWLSDSVQGLEHLGWAGASPQPVFRAYSQGKYGLVYGRGTHMVFDEMLQPALPRSDSGANALAQIAWIGGQCKLVVHHLDEEKINVADYEGRITGADYPTLLNDGRVAFVAHIDTQPLPYPDYGKGEGGRSLIAIYDGELWTFGDPVEHISKVVASEEGRVAWIADHGAQERVEVFSGGEFTSGEFHDSIDPHEFTFLGEEPLYVTQGTREQLVHGDRGGPVGKSVNGVERLSDGITPFYELYDGENSFLIVGDRSFGPHRSIWIKEELYGQELIYYTVYNEAWTQVELVIVSMRPGEIEGPPLLVETYDEIDVDYTNVDRSRLVYFASVGGLVKRVTLDLEMLRSDG